LITEAPNHAGIAHVVDLQGSADKFANGSLERHQSGEPGVFIA